MNPTDTKSSQIHRSSKFLGRAAGTLMATALPALADPLGDAGPWGNAVDVLMGAFTGPIAKGLSLVAIVIGGLMFAFGEGNSKRAFSGLLFGIGMAVSAVNFYTWLFGR